MKKEPNYKRIYSDMIEVKYPELKDFLKLKLFNKKLSSLDIIDINEKITSLEHSTQSINKYKVYSEDDIKIILGYQRDNNLNNSQTAKHFKMSRNTLYKWKKNFK